MATTGLSAAWYHDSNQVVNLQQCNHPIRLFKYRTFHACVLHHVRILIFFCAEYSRVTLYLATRFYIHLDHLHMHIYISTCMHILNQPKSFLNRAIVMYLKKVLPYHMMFIWRLATDDLPACAPTDTPLQVAVLRILIFALPKYAIFSLTSISDRCSICIVRPGNTISYLELYILFFKGSIYCAHIYSYTPMFRVPVELQRADNS